MLCPACFPNRAKDLIAGRKRRNEGENLPRKREIGNFCFVFGRQKCAGGEAGEVVGNGNGNSIGRREIGEERTNHRWPTRSKENHDKPILFRFLSLSVSIFRNEPMSKWWYYWLIRLGSELRNRRGIEERKIHAIVSTQSYLVSSLHRNSVSRPETSILFSISRKNGEKRQEEEEEEEEGVSACSV